MNSQMKKCLEVPRSPEGSWGQILSLWRWRCLLPRARGCLHQLNTNSEPIHASWGFYMQISLVRPDGLDHWPLVIKSIPSTTPPPPKIPGVFEALVWGTRGKLRPHVTIKGVPTSLNTGNYKGFWSSRPGSGIRSKSVFLILSKHHIF